jgi:hypothetical protein
VQSMYTLAKSTSAILYALGAVSALSGVYLAFGIRGVFISAGLGGLLALQAWLASSGEGDPLNAHIVRGPPDGG